MSAVMHTEKFFGILTSLTNRFTNEQLANGRLANGVPFENEGFYGRLSKMGSKSGLTVYVFLPADVDWDREAVTGYRYDTVSRTWRKETFPLPDVVYDRCFFTNRRQYQEYRDQLGMWRRYGKTTFLSYGLKGKWDVQRMLMRERELRPYLPETVPYEGKASLARWLKSRDEAFLKPQGGCQGRGALRLCRNGLTGEITVNGRDRDNRMIKLAFRDFGMLMSWLAPALGTRPYLIQQYLQLEMTGGGAFDIRSLVQKDGSGRWQLTGLAVRRGPVGSVTSNLHGGGEALPMQPFLAREFGEARAQELCAELTALSKSLPLLLERHHGRLAELGLDFGVDRGGRVWLLEANSKPGRSVFARLHDHQAREAAHLNPLRYAAFLLSRKQRDDAPQVWSPAPEPAALLNPKRRAERQP